MGWDAEQAEDAYWQARAEGKTDAEILAEEPDDWPDEDEPEQGPVDHGTDFGDNAHEHLAAFGDERDEVARQRDMDEAVARAHREAVWCGWNGKTRGLRWRDLLDSPNFRLVTDETQTIGQEKTMESAPKRMRRNALAARIEAAEAQLREARAELAKMNMPEEPLADFMDSHPLGRPVVTFELRFNGVGRIYTYAAVRAGLGRWYLTGSTTPNHGMTWDALMEWIERTGELVGSIRLATNFRELDS